MADLELPISVQVTNPIAVDKYYGAWPSVAAANAAVPVVLRSCIGPTGTSVGRTVGIKISGIEYEYWWAGGTADGDLVLKTSGGGGSLSIQQITINAAGTAITAPTLGNIRLVELNVAADTQYTGLAATGSGKLYLIKQLQEFAASFSVDIDDVVAGDTVLNAAGQSRLIWDVSAGVFKKLI